MTTRPEARLSSGRFLAAATAGTVLVLSAPFMGDVRRWLRLLLPDQFLFIVGGVVGLMAALAIGWAVRNIHENRARRYGLLALALGLAASYSGWSALGIPDSDAVERVHFIEYGLVAWLFYRAWRPLGDVTVLVLAFVSAVTVGTLEEWLQWFIPGRVGEIRDVLLNSAAIVCGILFSVAVESPARLARPTHRGLQWLGLVTAAAVAALSTFVDVAHLGHRIQTAQAGMFDSIYTGDDLRQLAVRRQAVWTLTPPLQQPASLGREDQYATEGLLHVRARNEAWSRGDVDTAWHENAILEEYFGPVLDAPSYVSATGHRWSPEQRADATRRAHADGRAHTYLSRAMNGFPILLWPRRTYRLSSLAVVLLLFGGALLNRRTGRHTSPTA